MWTVEKIESAILRTLRAARKAGLSAGEISSQTGIAGMFLFPSLSQMEKLGLLRSALTDETKRGVTRRIYYLTTVGRVTSSLKGSENA